MSQKEAKESQNAILDSFNKYHTGNSYVCCYQEKNTNWISWFGKTVIRVNSCQWKEWSWNFQKAWKSYHGIIAFYFKSLGSLSARTEPQEKGLRRPRDNLQLLLKPRPQKKVAFLGRQSKESWKVKAMYWSIAVIEQRQLVHRARQPSVRQTWAKRIWKDNNNRLHRSQYRLMGSANLPRVP